MRSSHVKLIKKSKKNHRVARPQQTGFSSPATHYNEPRIDLNDELIKNSSATFYVRVKGENFTQFEVNDNDVLIVDKSLTPKENNLALVNIDGEFKIIRIKNMFHASVEVWGIITYIIKSVI